MKNFRKSHTSVLPKLVLIPVETAVVSQVILNFSTMEGSLNEF